MKHPHFHLVAALLLAALPTAQAKVYACMVDGTMVYTSSPQGHCQQARLQPIGSYSNHAAAYRNASTASNNTGRAPANTVKPHAASHKNAPASASAASTASTVPRGNNTGRRQILEQELINERQALTQAQKALSDGRTLQAGDKNNYQQYQERVRQLENTLLDRQQNVQALQRELGRM